MAKLVASGTIKGGELVRLRTSSLRDVPAGFTVPAKLLSLDNPKVLKGAGSGYLTAILHLAPSTESGYNTCASSSDGCSEACLYFSGRGAFQRTQEARINKTRYFYQARAQFMAQLAKEVAQLQAMAGRNGEALAVRLNGTSDIRFECVKVGDAPNIMTLFPNVIFYDYTKHFNRRNLPANYHLTFSRSERNEAQAVQWLRNGGSVAVVFAGALPAQWNSFSVIDGDVNDLRFIDPANVVVGLKAKGKAKKDASGFVVANY